MSNFFLKERLMRGAGFEPAQALLRPFWQKARPKRPSKLLGPKRDQKRSKDRIFLAPLSVTCFFGTSKMASADASSHPFPKKDV